VWLNGKVKTVGTGPHRGKGVKTNPLPNPAFYNNAASQGKTDMFQVPL